VLQLCELARSYDIGLNIDAEEADRLELSLDLLERWPTPGAGRLERPGLCDSGLPKRCPYVIDYLIDLARRSERRLMVRLVKGAYWDSEIKRAQVDGLSGLPGLHPQAPHRCGLYCLRSQAAGRPDAIYPQFATHNAQTVASIEPGRAQPYTPDVTSSNACTAWASRSTCMWSRPRTRPHAALPHLCSRYARNTAGLSGAPPAGKRRQQLIRTPHRQPRLAHL
jgi:hypothetical protein